MGKFLPEPPREDNNQEFLDDEEAAQKADNGNSGHIVKVKKRPTRRPTDFDKVEKSASGQMRDAIQWWRRRNVFAT